MVDVPPTNPRSPASPTLCGSLVTPRASALRPSRWPCPGHVVVVVYPLSKETDCYNYYHEEHSRETAVDHGKARTEDSSSACVRPLCPSCVGWRRPGATSVFGHTFIVDRLEMRIKSAGEIPGRRRPRRQRSAPQPVRRGLSAAGHDTRSVRDSLPGMPLPAGLALTVRLHTSAQTNSASPWGGMRERSLSRSLPGCGTGASARSLSVRRTGTVLTFPTTSLCANRSAGSRSVQPAGPSGGPEQAGAIRRGSP